jgi:hypothetical protein
MGMEVQMNMIAAVVEMNAKGGPEGGCRSTEEWVAYARLLYPPDCPALPEIVKRLNGELGVRHQESAKNGIKDAHALVMQQLEGSTLLQSMAAETPPADEARTAGTSLVTNPSPDVVDGEEEEEEGSRSRGSLSAPSTNHTTHEDQGDCSQQ